MLKARRFSFSLLATLFGLALLAGTARADWKAQVRAAGGTWESKVTGNWGKILAPNSQELIDRLPRGLSTMLRAEVRDNPWITKNVEMREKLGAFRPEAQQVFDLPYIPIPADKMKHAYEASSMSGAMRENIAYNAPDGKKYFRYFFHPLYADKYKELIETYGVKYDYQAVPTSSPRSLIAWKKNEPQQPIWVKVSLHRELDSYTVIKNGRKITKGLSRVQAGDKAQRSAAVNEAFASTKAGELARHRLNFFPEPASLVPGEISYKGKAMRFDRATIFRDIPEELTANGATKFVPAFTFISNMKESLDAVNADRQAKGEKPINAIGWVTKGLVEPLTRAYVHMGLEHGLVGDLHTQNFLIEVKDQTFNNKAVAVPTGKLLIKDLDGFRVDVGLRARNGRSVSFLQKVEHPFEWARFSATQGAKKNGAVFFGKFLKQIRNINGFNTTCTVDGQEKTIHATPAGQVLSQLRQHFPNELATLTKLAEKRYPGSGSDKVKLEEKAVEQVFDLVARAQLTRQTGIKVDMKDWSWSRDGGYDSGLNQGLNKLREELFKGQKALGADLSGSKMQTNPGAQQVLGSLFNKYRTAEARKADDRTWVNGLKPNVYRMIDDGHGTKLIEGISRSGRHAGWAIVKPTDLAGLQADLQAKGLQPMAATRLQNRLSTYAARDLNSLQPMTWFAARSPTATSSSTPGATAAPPLSSPTAP